MSALAGLIAVHGHILQWLPFSNLPYVHLKTKHLTHQSTVKISRKKKQLKKKI